MTIFDIAAFFAVIGGVLNVVYAWMNWKSRCYSARVAIARAFILIVSSGTFLYQRLKGADLPALDQLIVMSFIFLLCLMIYEVLVKIGVYHQ